jgi:hypothetical protein
MISDRVFEFHPIHPRFCAPMPTATVKKWAALTRKTARFMYIALKRAGIPVELQIYASGNDDFVSARTINFHRARRSSASTGCVAWSC